MTDTVIIRPIGRIQTPYDKIPDTPVQSLFSEKEGIITVDDAYEGGLEGIEAFSHLILITYLHKAPTEMLKETPMVDGGDAHGIFATRHMCRPNKIGFSIVRLINRNKTELIVSGADLLNGTPVLDIKPYIPVFDAAENASCGWLTQQHIENIKTKSQKL